MILYMPHEPSPGVAPRVAVLILQFGIAGEIVLHYCLVLGLRSHRVITDTCGWRRAAALGFLALPPQLLSYCSVGAFERDAGERGGDDAGGLSRYDGDAS